MKTEKTMDRVFRAHTRKVSLNQVPFNDTLVNHLQTQHYSILGVTSFLCIT